MDPRRTMDLSLKREKHAARMRQWRRDNPEAVRAIDRRRREKLKNDPERLARERAYNARKQREYRARDPEGTRLRRREEMHRTRLRRFGLTEEEFDRLVALQDGRCAICGEPPPEGERLQLDHDHRTGLFRGLLCGSCNGGMGLLGDDPQRLRQAADYIEENSL